MAKMLSSKRTGDVQATAAELYDFMKRVRSGARVSNDDIKRFAKLFNDEITLDSVDRCDKGHPCGLCAHNCALCLLPGSPADAIFACCAMLVSCAQRAAGEHVQVREHPCVRNRHVPALPAARGAAKHQG
jgi:hypothetical protein